MGWLKVEVTFDQGRPRAVLSSDGLSTRCLIMALSELLYTGFTAADMADDHLGGTGELRNAVSHLVEKCLFDKSNVIEGRVVRFEDSGKGVTAADPL